jgi:hypothetical protein
MKGVLLIGILIAFLIVAYLTVSRMQSKPVPAALSAPEIGLNGTLTELPKQVQGKVEAALQKAEEQRKAAEEALK